MVNFKDKKLIPVYSILLTISIVSAVWLMGPVITGFTTFSIRSDKPNLSISVDLLGGDFDTTSGPLNFSDVLVIDSNVNEKAMFLADTIKTDDLSDTCDDYEDDCSLRYFLGEQVGYGFDELDEIFNNDTIQLLKGDNTITIIGSCNQYSCPGNVSALINIFLKQKS